MTVRITWIRIEEETQVLWQVNRGLYAYVGPEGEIVYIGKVHGKTVRRRSQPSAKPRLWNFVQQELGLAELDVIVGVIQIPEGCRHSRQLLSDIESLLIYEVRPPGNIACLNSRIARPGLVVRCYGDWSYRRKAFIDPTLT